MRAILRLNSASIFLFCAACGAQQAASPDQASAPEPESQEAASAEEPQTKTEAAPVVQGDPPELLSQKLLFQPELHWEGGETSRQGTAFAIQSGERCFIATSTHYLRFDGPALESIGLIGSEKEGSLGAANLSWGRPGTGGTTEASFMDLSDDVLLLPCREVPGGRAAVSFTELADVQVGDAVWLPNENRSAPTGHVPLQGAVTQVTSGWISVRFESLDLASQSGSPVISEGGELVGLFSRALKAKDGSVEVFLTPARAVWKMASSAEGVFPLKHTIRDVGLGQEVELAFDWEPGMVLDGLGRVAKEGVPAQVGQFTLEAKAGQDGLHIIRTDPTGTVVRVVSSDGKFLALEDAEEVTERALNAAGIEQMPPEQQAELREAITPEVTTGAARSEWNRIVGEWVDAQFALGRLYQKESQAPSPFGDAAVPALTTVTATQRTPCGPQDADLGCVKLVATTTYDPVALMRRLKAMLHQAPAEERKALEVQLKNATLEVSMRRSLVTHAESLVPVHASYEKFVNLVGQRKEYSLDERIYQPK